MRRGGEVLARFRLPDPPPAEVAELAARFDEVADRYAERLGEIQDAEEALEAAKAQDSEALVAAVLEGQPEPQDPSKNERDADARLRALRATLEPLAAAVDQSGNAMLPAIESARDTWAADLEAEREEAAARYLEVMEDAQAALDKLGKATSALTWLREFDVDEARFGVGNDYHGKAAPLVVEDLRGRQEDARRLLELAAKAPSALRSREELRAARQADEDAKRAARRAAVA